MNALMYLKNQITRCIWYHPSHIAYFIEINKEHAQSQTSKFTSICCKNYMQYESAQTNGDFQHQRCDCRVSMEEFSAVFQHSIGNCIISKCVYFLVIIFLNVYSCCCVIRSFIFSLKINNNSIIFNLRKIVKTNETLFHQALQSAIIYVN